MKRKGKHPRRRLAGRKGPRIVPGQSPGTILADPDAPPPRLKATWWTPSELEERELASPREIAAVRAKGGVLWVEVTGLGDADVIRQVGEAFDLHDLALEDVVNTGQRDKVETYEDHLFVVSRVVRHAERLEHEQIALFLGDGWVVTFHEGPTPELDPVRARIRKRKPRLSERGADYLAYALLDALVDHLFPVVESYGESIDALETQVLARPEPDVLAELHRMKRDLVTLRRLVWGRRDALQQLVREPGELITEDTTLYLRDTQDHAVQAIEIVVAYGEAVGGLVDAYLSMVSHRMNEVMKVLTIIATIFIPLTFVAGIYGMNFSWMPELSWRWGYPVALLAMAVTAAALVVYFRRKGWIGGGSDIGALRALADEPEAGGPEGGGGQPPR